ncbi:hypothetical protein BYT27DRAFT_7213219 [Phlegmacium glaucopus]|nr:hypothetical protein BYT27DRAFT_7213219 [Phlegmacium glaucopus]
MAPSKKSAVKTTSNALNDNPNPQSSASSEDTSAPTQGTVKPKPAPKPKASSKTTDYLLQPFASMPATIASMPATIASTPATIASTPATITSMPATIASTPATIASMPATVDITALLVRVAAQEAEIDRLKKSQAMAKGTTLKEIARPHGTITNLQRAMGLENDRSNYMNCQATVSDVVAYAGIQLDIDWRHQDPISLSKIASVARSRNSQLCCYKGNWATLEIMKTIIKNKRNYCTKIGCSICPKPANADKIEIKNNINSETPEQAEIEIDDNLNSKNQFQEQAKIEIDDNLNSKNQFQQAEIENQASGSGAGTQDIESLFSNSDEEISGTEGSSSGKEREGSKAGTKQKATESGGKGKRARVKNSILL